MFIAGDLVRLQFGRTPLQVLAVFPDGRVRAKYCHNSRVEANDIKSPLLAHGCQTRNHAEFVFWDGKKPYGMNQGFYDNRHIMPRILQQKEEEMPLKYMPLRIRGNQTHIIGTVVGSTLNGRKILEFGDGRIEAFYDSEIRLYQERVIQVVSLKNDTYTCFYRVPALAEIHVDNLLMSDSGNVYRVIHNNVTRDARIKGAFKGKRLLTKDI